MYLVLSVVVLGYGWKRLDFDSKYTVFAAALRAKRAPPSKPPDKPDEDEKEEDKEAGEGLEGSLEDPKDDNRVLYLPRDLRRSTGAGRLGSPDIDTEESSAAEQQYQQKLQITARSAGKGSRFKRRRLSHPLYVPASEFV